VNSIDGEHNSLLLGGGRAEFRANLWEQGWNEEPNSQNKGGAEIAKLISWDYGWGRTLSSPTFLREGLTCQSQSSCGVTQLPPGENRNISDNLGVSGSEWPYCSVATALWQKEQVAAYKPASW
jgi:hypothetical protein